MPRVIEQRSVLTAASIFSGIQQELYGVAKQSADDTHQLGWRPILPSERLCFQLSNIRFLTAEGLNTFASLALHLRAANLLEIDLDTSSKKIFTSLGIGYSGEVAGHTTGYVDVSNGCFALPPKAYCLNSKSDALMAASEIASLACQFPTKVKLAGHPQFIETLKRLVTESLLNIEGHAYRDSNDLPIEGKWAIISVTIAPASSYLSSDETLKRRCGPLESDWLVAHMGNLVFEISVSDVGCGIPKRLWKNTYQRQPELFQRIIGLGSGTNVFKEERAILQSQLCADAFHHTSTSKSERDFDDTYHLLNWRGLFRCRREVAEFGGFITLASGRGRAGFATLSKANDAFVHVEPGEFEFPGTSFVVRFGLPIARITDRTPRRLSTSERQVPWNIRLEPWDNFGKSQDSHPKIRPVDAESQVVGLVFPFQQITRDHSASAPAGEIPAARLLQMLSNERVSPQIVPILVHAYVNQESGPAFWRSEDTQLYTYPRLLGIWYPDGRGGQITWTFAGVIPKETEVYFDELFRNGHCLIGRTSPASVASFMSEVAVNYSEFFSFDLGKLELTLKVFGAQISSATFDKAFKEAFSLYWKNESLRRSVIIKGNILLHTGTSVDSYLSVLYLVASSRLMAATVGRRLTSLTNSTGTISAIVTDEHGSRFVAQCILRDVDSHPEIMSPEAALALHPGTTVVIFVDAIFRGRTVSEFADKLLARGVAVQRIIACVDLRKAKSDFIGNGIPIEGLLPITNFQPAIIEGTVSAKSQIRIDQVAHVWREDESSEYVGLGTTIGSETLLRNHPELVEHGLHVLGERLHTISLPVSRLVALHKSDLVALLSAQIIEFIKSLGDGPSSLVFYYRSEGSVRKIIDEVFKHVRQSHGIATPGFAIELLISHRGTRAVFAPAGRASVPIWRQLEANELFPSKSPQHGYLAIYIDDAAVSGRTLRNFLYSVTRGLIGIAPVDDDAKFPQAILALPVVNRLSPGEMKFIKLCSTMTGSNGKTYPFSLESIFRLQVRFQDTTNLNDHLFISIIQSGDRIRHPILTKYFSDVCQRLESCSDTVRYLFYPLTPIDPQPLSFAAIQLRHLLALNMQNEGVVADILVTFTTLMRLDDVSLLDLFAIEPYLLKEPPFDGICRDEIVSFCVRVINGSYPVWIKSNALLVLAAVGEQFFAKLDSIMTSILAEECLWKQVLVLCLGYFEGSEKEGEILFGALDRCTTQLSDTSTLVRTIFSSSRQFRRNLAIIKNESDADRQVRRLIPPMLKHEEQFADQWEDLTKWLSQLVDSWDYFDSEVARAGVVNGTRKAAVLAADILLPAILGLQWMANKRGESSLAQELGDAYFEASRLLADFVRLRPDAPHEITHELVITLHNTFSSLCRSTWASISSDRVLGGSVLDSKAAVICRTIAQFYCAPCLICITQIDSLFERDSKASRFEEGLQMVKDALTDGLTIIVCRIPVDAMASIFRRLAENVIQHGNVATMMARKTVVKEDDGTDTLFIEFDNSILNPKAATRTGLATASAIGAPYLVKINSRQEGELWRTTVQIPNVFSESAHRKNML